ncbi:MAG: ion transporter, partial [Pseudomonadota bacterium]
MASPPTNSELGTTGETQLLPRKGGTPELLFRVIFGHQTPAGRRFDLVLIILIVCSVVAVLLDSIETINARWGEALLAAEWIFTAVFTIEYFVRLAIVDRPWRYARSFYGIVDLLSVLPTYLSLIFTGANSLLVIRVLRILRVFRILKLVRYLGEANMLVTALKASRRKILVFVISVLSLVVIFGAIMYLVEGPERGFTSIPRSMYWAIVTLTTVGYGDISPVTPLGQAIASVIMILGYGIIAVPTGIYTAELSQELRRDYDRRRCGECGREGHERDA